MKQHELNVLRGVENLDRIDEALYHDYETDIAKEVSGQALVPGLHSVRPSLL